jgi:hypothetical protein
MNNETTHKSVVIVNETKTIIDCNKKLHPIKFFKLSKICLNDMYMRFYNYFLLSYEITMLKFETISLWCDSLLAHIKYLQNNY